MFGYCIGSNEYVVMKMEIFFHWRAPMVLSGLYLKGLQD